MEKSDFINFENVYKIGYKAGYDDALKHAGATDRRAAWVKLNVSDDNGNRYYLCSNCEKGDAHDEAHPVMYCWNCGSVMTLPEISQDEWEAANDEETH